MEELCDWTTDLKRLLGSGSITERQSFIRSFVKEIKVTGDEAKLTYTMPELSQSQNDGGSNSSCIVRYGGRYWTRTSVIPDCIEML